MTVINVSKYCSFFTQDYAFKKLSVNLLQRHNSTIKSIPFSYVCPRPQLLVHCVVCYSLHVIENNCLHNIFYNIMYQHSNWIRFDFNNFSNYNTVLWINRTNENSFIGKKRHSHLSSFDMCIIYVHTTFCTNSCSILVQNI